MNLDLPTLMVMQSFALACAGAVLLFGHGRKTDKYPL
jgi:hypothetical protein